MKKKYYFILFLLCLYIFVMVSLNPFKINTNDFIKDNTFELSLIIIISFMINSIHYLQRSKGKKR